MDTENKKIAYFGFTGAIESQSATRIASAVNTAVNGECDAIHLAFSSPGGLVADGMYLYNYIRALPIPIVAHNIGTVASIALLVFLAAEKRFCSSHAMFMTHPTAFPGADGLTWERLDGLRSATLADDERTENILRERTSMPNEVLGARRVRDVHIAPEEALKFGIVHAVEEMSLPQGHKIFQI